MPNESLDLFDNSVTPPVQKEKDPSVVYSTAQKRIRPLYIKSKTRLFGMSSTRKGNVESLSGKKQRSFALTDRASKEEIQRPIQP